MRPESQECGAPRPSRAFQLARQCATSGIVGVVAAIVIATLLLSLFYRRLAMNDLMQMGERQNVALARVFLNTVLPQLRSFLLSAERLSDDELRSDAETAELRRAVVSLMQGISVVKVKVYDLRGRTVFSTEGKQIGEDKQGNAGFRRARGGEVASEITHRDHVSDFEGVIENRDLIASYVPVHGMPGSFPVEAVFELYQDMTPLLQNIERTQRRVTVGVMLVLGCLYIVIIFILRRADRMMRQQARERRAAEQDLAGRTQELERSYGDIQILHEIGCIILQTPDHGAALQHILTRCLAARAFDIGVVRLLQPGTHNYRVAAYLGYCQPEGVASHHARLHDGVSRRLTTKMLAAREPVVEENVQAGEGLRTFKKENVQAAVVVPVRADDQILGVLQLGSRTARKFRPDELRFLASVGNLIGIAAQKHQMFEEVLQAKSELEQTVKKLERSNAELQQFAYVASHDLQEPLRMITGYTNLLAKRYKGKLDPIADEFIAFAVDGADRMRVLINDLLAYSRVRSHPKKVASTDCELVLSHTLMGLQIAIQESRVKISHDPLPVVLADDVQLLQLFQNLIGNAIKFRSSDEPMVHIGCERRENDWLFSVRDNGIGIDPQHADKIFIIFQRLHHREAYPGTGIGLAVCKRIVERHGGKIWLESAVGAGATFYFTLPSHVTGALQLSDAVDGP